MKAALQLLGPVFKKCKLDKYQTCFTTYRCLHCSSKNLHVNVIKLFNNNNSNNYYYRTKCNNSNNYYYIAKCKNCGNNSNNSY